MATPEDTRAGISRRALLGIAGAIVLAAAWPRVAGQAAPRSIRVVARRYLFEPEVIELRQGEPVVLEFDAPEVIMGFNLRAFGIRADLLPGQITRVPLTPAKVGEFPFYCDLFCGSGHEDMDGLLRVIA